jgi:hypothetical protein
VARVGKTGGACVAFVGKPEGKRLLEKLGVDGWIRLK